MSLGNPGDNWGLMTCISTHSKHYLKVVRCHKFWLISMANWFARKCAVILLSKYDHNALTRHQWIVRWKTWSEAPRFSTHTWLLALLSFEMPYGFFHLFPKSLDFFKVTKMFRFPEDLIWLSTALIHFCFWKKKTLTKNSTVERDVSRYWRDG